LAGRGGRRAGDDDPVGGFFVLVNPIHLRHALGQFKWMIFFIIPD